ncbi:hypothetical protein [Streptomyces anulatus]|uniref:hypothetical protein n=1 Tax=Streptomyces anulatus TaxID=1892 RepID=UPI003688EECA
MPTGAAAVAAEKDGTGAMLEDLEWTDVLLLGTPTRFGPPAGPPRSGIQAG